MLSTPKIAILYTCLLLYRGKIDYARRPSKTIDLVPWSQNLERLCFEIESNIYVWHQIFSRLLPKGIRKVRVRYLDIKKSVKSIRPLYPHACPFSGLPRHFKSYGNPMRRDARRSMCFLLSIRACFASGFKIIAMLLPSLFYISHPKNSQVISSKACLKTIK